MDGGDFQILVKDGDGGGVAEGLEGGVRKLEGFRVGAAISVGNPFAETEVGGGDAAGGGGAAEGGRTGVLLAGDADGDGGDLEGRERIEGDAVAGADDGLGGAAGDQAMARRGAMAPSCCSDTSSRL